MKKYLVEITEKITYKVEFLPIHRNTLKGA